MINTEARELTEADKPGCPADDKWNCKYCRDIKTCTLHSAPAESAQQDEHVKADRRTISEAFWNPIETAPNDGTLFVAYHPTFVNKFWVLGYQEISLNGFTHWMPLPAAPNAPESKEG